VILRILGDGQYEIDEERVAELNALDAELTAAVERDDGATFSAKLNRLLEGVRAAARRLPDDYLGPSDLVLPAGDSRLEEVRAMLGEEGLIPG
jgi:hypothetical protein